MKTKILLWTFLMILISLIATATTNDALDYWSFNNDNVSGASLYNWSDGQTLTLNGGATGLTGVLYESINLTGATDNAQASSSIISSTSSFTVSIWVKTTDTDGIIVGNGDNVNGFYFSTEGAATDRLNARFGSTTHSYEEEGLIASGNWLHAVLTYNSSSGKINSYVDTVKKHNGVSVTAVASNDNLFVGNYIDGASAPLIAQFDEFFIYDRVLTDDEIGELYNSGSAYNPYAPIPPVPDTINLSEIFPANYSIFNVNTINFNTTGNFSYPSKTNCSLYINSTLNSSINGFASGTEQLVSFNLTFPSGQENIYSYYIECIDNNTAENTSNYILEIDQISPILTTDFVNNTFVFNRNYTVWINASDGLALNSVNVSIDGLTYIYNDTMTTSSYNKQLTINALNLSSGTHNLTVRVADGHTAKNLYHPEGWNWANGLFNDYLRFEWELPYNPGEVTIKQKGGSVWNHWEAEQDFDRFRFIFEPNTPSSSYTFEIETDMGYKVFDVPGSKYKKWLVLGDHWLDFYYDGTEQITITPITDKEVEVTVSNLPVQDSYTFNSAGDLNIVTETFNFTTTNYTYTYVDPVLLLEQQNMKFIVDDITGLTSTLTLDWNNTEQTVTKTTNASSEIHSSTFTTPDLNQNANITVNWNYTLTLGAATETGTVSFTQEVLNIGIDNCGTYTTQAINYSIKNETDESLLIGDAAAHFQVWVNSSSNYKPFNLSWSNVSTFGVCINPSSLNITYYTQLEYTAAGQTKTYYINNANLDNVTNYVNLYIEDGTTLVTFTIIDENDAPLEGAFLHVLSYDIGTDSFKTTEILETDSNGKAVGNIILNTQFYKFLITYNDAVVFESDNPSKITSTTQTIQVTLGTDYLDTFTEANNIACSMDYDNSTKGFSYTFIDSTGTGVEGCLEIIRSTLNSETVINQSCVTSAAGTINLYIGENVLDYTYYARGLITVDGSEFVCADKSVSFKDTYKKFGTDGIMATFLLTIALIAIGLWNPIAAIVFAMIAFVASWFLGFFFLTPAYLIAIIIAAIVFIVRLNR